MRINLIDARRGLYNKCLELFNDKNIAEKIYRYLCDGIEDCEVVEPFNCLVEDFTKEMREISQDNDIESAHYLADKLMCKMLREIGCDEGVKIFEEMGKWYS